MKRKGPRPRPRQAEPVQYFTYGPWRFNVNHALALAANAEKYRPLSRYPRPDWVGPNIDIDDSAIEGSDLTRPVLFATIVADGRPGHLLIDGNHRVLKALRHQAQVLMITLDLSDTLKVLHAPGNWVQQMRRDGARLGLLGGSP